jgi:hypothetical protein
MCADPEVMRYLGGKPFPGLKRGDTWPLLLATGTYVATVTGQSRKSNGSANRPTRIPNPVGWPLLRSVGHLVAAWGKGFATEGARRQLRRYDSTNPRH